MADPIANFINSFGKSGVPLMLIVGGAFATLLSGIVGKKFSPLTSAAGFIAMGAGVALYVNTTAFSGRAGVILPSNDIETKMYANPVNDFSNIPKKNRFDLQTNYIMSPTQEDYMNDLILNEVKAMGIGSNNYPVRMNPWELKTLIPTTQVEPSRDFNTVKMVMA